MTEAERRPRIANRVVRWLLAAAFVLAGAACAESLRHNLPYVSRAHDLFGLSELASGVLVLLFASAFIGCLLPRPGGAPALHRRTAPLYVLASMIGIGISVLVIAAETPTSFVSWTQLRGAPLPWLENGHYYGPCVDVGRICRTYWFVSARPLPLLLDLGVIAAAAHFVRRLTAH